MSNEVAALIDKLEGQVVASLDVMDAVKAGYDYNPGSSDLDNEQPIWVLMTLGDYRKACRLAREK